VPIITRFYGIIIKMYFNDHLPPHFHAIYNDFNGIFDLKNLELIEGDLPAKATKLIKEWAEMYKVDLLRMWETKDFIKLPGLE
jgi:hypothetical protein